MQLFWLCVGIQEACDAVAPRQVPGRGGQKDGGEEIHGHCRRQGGSYWSRYPAVVDVLNIVLSFMYVTGWDTKFEVKECW